MTIPSPLILAIETSCDDTACALVDGRGVVRSSVVSSQPETHRPYGGVVPELASREHLQNWPAVSHAALDRAGVELAEVEGVAATRGPGLIGALLVGMSIAKALAWSRGLPFFAVHHLEGHLFSPFLGAPGEPAATPPEEFVGLVVSGGHTTLYQVVEGAISTLAETRDDAMGEAFDKVGKRFGLPYPQGPLVDRLAEDGDPASFALSIPRMSDGSLDFSYSGLKTQTMVEIERRERAGLDLTLTAEPHPQLALDLLASFRAAAVAQLVDRLDRLSDERPPACLAVSGGVAANRLLRRELRGWAEERGVDLRLVRTEYAGDNAAMIGHAALQRARSGDVDDPLASEAASRLPIA